MCTLIRARLLSTIGASALMLGARMEELAYAEGRGPHRATKDNATDFVGVEEDPFE